MKRPGTKLEHQGIKVEFIGEIELYQDRSNHHEFTSLVKDLARPSELLQNTSFSFEFVNVEKPYESYTGTNVRLRLVLSKQCFFGKTTTICFYCRYFLRVTISRRLTDIIKEMEIVVHTLSHYPEVNSPIKMEVGIEDCLHIEFEYNKSKSVVFLSPMKKVKINHMIFLGIT